MIANRELRKLGERAREAQKILTEHSSEIQRGFEFLEKNLTKNVLESLKKATQMFNNPSFVKWERSVLSPEVIKKIFSKQNENITKGLKRALKGWQDAQIILFKLGWFPSAGWDIRNARAINKLYAEGRVEELEKKILRYYTNKRTQTILSSWKKKTSLKSGRLRILKEVVSVHCSGKYALSIIVLLTQIEGQMRDVIGKYEKIDHGEIIKKYKSKIKAKIVKDTFEESVVDTILGVLSKNVFNHGYNPRTKQTVYARNSVVHGFYTGDFTRKNSTKLILLMNFIITNESVISGETE